MEKELEKLLSAIEDWGLDHAIRYSSDWKDIEDERFHELRSEFKRIAQELEDHIEKMV